MYSKEAGIIKMQHTHEFICTNCPQRAYSYLMNCFILYMLLFCQLDFEWRTFTYNMLNYDLL